MMLRLEERRLEERFNHGFEDILKNKLKGQLEKYCRKYENERLVLDEIVSIYKPYWICKYNGKKIFLDA